MPPEGAGAAAAAGFGAGGGTTAAAGAAGATAFGSGARAAAVSSSLLSLPKIPPALDCATTGGGALGAGFALGAAAPKS